MKTETTKPLYHELSTTEVIARSMKNLTKMKAQDMSDDPQFADRVRHTMLPDEKLAEWIARVGMSRAQVMAASPEEISHRVELAMEAAKDEPSMEQFRPRPIPLRFNLD